MNDRLRGVLPTLLTQIKHYKESIRSTRDTFSAEQREFYKDLSNVGATIDTLRSKLSTGKYVQISSERYYCFTVIQTTVLVMSQVFNALPITYKFISGIG